MRRGQGRVFGRGQEGDPCSSALRAPKVALMFLTRGPMHHEELWTRWLASAANLVPADLLRFVNCTDSFVEQLRRMCQAPQGAGALEAQHLFTVYVHSQPDFTGALMCLIWGMHVFHLLDEARASCA